MTIYLTHDSVFWQLGWPYLGNSCFNGSVIRLSSTVPSAWNWFCGMTAAGRVSLLLHGLLCFSRPAGTCLHDNWAGFQERVDVDSGLLRPCPQNWHVVTYTTLYWPTESHSQPTFKKWKKKLHSLMQRNSKLHWKGVNIRKTERLWPVFQSTVPHWEIYFIGAIVLFIMKWMIMKPTNKSRHQWKDVYILLFQSSHTFSNVTSGSA